LEQHFEILSLNAKPGYVRLGYRNVGLWKPKPA